MKRIVLPFCLFALAACTNAGPSSSDIETSSEEALTWNDVLDMSKPRNTTPYWQDMPTTPYVAAGQIYVTASARAQRKINLDNGFTMTMRGDGTGPWFTSYVTNGTGTAQSTSFFQFGCGLNSPYKSVQGFATAAVAPGARWGTNDFQRMDCGTQPPKWHIDDPADTTHLYAFAPGDAVTGVVAGSANAVQIEQSFHAAHSYGVNHGILTAQNANGGAQVLFTNTDGSTAHVAIKVFAHCFSADGTTSKTVGKTADRTVAPNTTQAVLANCGGLNLGSLVAYLLVE